MSAVGNKIPKFNDVAAYMGIEGVPFPQVALVGAILFLIVGSISVVLGYWTRVGALLLLIFIVLATYFFHDFWNLAGEAQQEQMIQFMKNLSITGALLLLIAGGPGAWSLDARHARRDIPTP